MLKNNWTMFGCGDMCFTTVSQRLALLTNRYMNIVGVSTKIQSILHIHMCRGNPSSGLIQPNTHWFKIRHLWCILCLRCHLELEEYRSPCDSLICAQMTKKRSCPSLEVIKGTLLVQCWPSVWVFIDFFVKLLFLFTISELWKRVLIWSFSSGFWITELNVSFT